MYIKNITIFFPQTTTARREYIPLDFIDSNIISNNSIFMISTDSKSIFGILISKMNMIWIKYMSGKHKGDYRYSSSLYNTFPFPKITAGAGKVEECVDEILIRKNSQKTLFELYDPETMPSDLREAHKKLDREVEKLYKSEDIYEKNMFKTEMGCLRFLLKLYESRTK